MHVFVPYESVEECSFGGVGLFEAGNLRGDAGAGVGPDSGAGVGGRVTVCVPLGEVLLGAMLVQCDA
jgi:hypothetical protein